MTLISVNLNAKPKISAGVDLTQSYTDNIQQVPENGDGSHISELGARVSVADEGAKTDYRFNFRHLNINYNDNSVPDRKENSGFAYLNRYELDERLRFFATSSIVNVDRDLNTLTGDFGREERVEVVNHSLGSRFNSGTRQYYDLNAELQYIKTKTDDKRVDVDTQVYRGNASLANGTRHRIFFWQLDSAYAEQKNDVSDTSDDRSAYGAIIGANLTKTWAVFAQANQEKVDQENEEEILFESWGAGVRLSRPRLSSSLAYNRTEEGTNDAFWSADLNWQPTNRTQLALNYGRRFFGETFSGSITHRTRKLSQNLTVSDSVSSFSQSVAANGILFCGRTANNQIDPTNCQVATETTELSSDFIPVFETTFNEVTENQTLNRLYSYTLSYVRPRSSFVVSLAWNRTKRLNEALDAQDYTVQKSGTANWLWNVSRKSRITVQARVDKNEEDDGLNESTDYAPSLAISNQFTRDVTGQATYTYIKRNADEPENDFEENRISLSLQADF